MDLAFRPPLYARYLLFLSLFPLDVVTCATHRVIAQNMVVEAVPFTVRICHLNY